LIEHVLQQDLPRTLRFFKERAVGGVFEGVKAFQRSTDLREEIAREVAVRRVVVKTDEEVDGQIESFDPRGKVRF
jgi:hypothetical protein